MKKGSQRWIRHDVNASDDEKLVRIWLKFGDMGLGYFWRVVEFLSRQPNYSYPSELLPITVPLRLCERISEGIKVASADAGAGAMLLDKIRLDEIRLDEIREEKNVASDLWKAFFDEGLFKSKAGSTYSQSLRERMGAYDTKRDTNKRSAEIRWLMAKVEIPHGINPDDVRTWLTYKAERRQSYKETGLQTLLNQWAKKPERFAQAVRRSMANNWSGIFEANKNGTAKKATTNDLNEGVINEIRSFDRGRKAN